MKIELLRSTFTESAKAANTQHLTCFVVNDRVAIDAGSLAMGCSDSQRANIRDVVLTHAHLDHIAGLPLFLDDLFSELTSPINIHASADTIEVLERDIFNWHVYPRFSELGNSSGPILKYQPFETGIDFHVAGLNIRPVPVNHKVPSSGFLISDADSRVAITGDTFCLNEFWTEINNCQGLSALLIECAFPDHLEDLARVSHHLTPKTLAVELKKFLKTEVPIYVINMKPMHREAITRELAAIDRMNLGIFEPGRVYQF